MLVHFELNGLAGQNGAFFAFAPDGGGNGMEIKN